MEKAITNEKDREKNIQSEGELKADSTERLWGGSHRLRGPSWLAFEPSKSNPYDKFLNSSIFLKVRKYRQNPIFT